MKLGRCLAVACGGLLAPSLSSAAECADGATRRVVAEIVFEGNEVTRRETLTRELAFGPGDPVCPADLRRGRQALLDLGLFRKVEWREEAVEDGLRVVYRLRERWYLLPIPRIDANSDDTFGLGISLNWNNVGGRNHRLSMSAVRRQLEERTLDDETIVNAAYNWRRFGGTRTNVTLRGGETRESAVDGERRFQDRETSLGVGASRQLTSYQTGQGWVLDGGLDWKRGSNRGVDAPPDEGALVAPGIGLSYTDLHSSVYSERGFTARVGLSASLPYLSDYNQTRLDASVLHIQPIGKRPHQRLHLRASAGSFHGGQPQRRSDAFELGGAGNLRGYENEFGEGDAFWTVAAEYLRPVGWDWLRFLAVLEAGQVHRASFPERDPGLMLSIGLGFRVRFTWFVDAEVELGVAYPLRDGDGARGFAGGV